MRYATVIFDMDGTILDTLGDLANSLNHALEANGYPARTIEEAREFLGNGVDYFVSHAIDAAEKELSAAMACGPGAHGGAEAPAAPGFRNAGAAFRGSFADVKASFLEHYKEHSAERTKPFDGIPEAIEALRAAGAKVAVISNKADFAVKDLCDDYFPGVFDVAVGEREGVKRKPAPDAVFEVLRQLGADASDCVYVGDSEVDVATAKAAGVAGIFVNWGYRGREFLLDHGAETVVDTPEEMNEVILG